MTPRNNLQFSSIRPEAELILASCTPNRERAAERVSALLSESLDWDFILDRASRNAVLPLLYRALQDAGIDRVPSAMIDRLRQYRNEVAARSLLFRAELESLLKLFDENDIRVMPLKGVTLAEDLYGDPALRETADIDLLVGREDVSRTLDLMLGRQYDLPDEFDTPDRLALHLKRDCEVCLLSRRTGVPVELHWETFPPHHHLEFGADSLWETAEKHPFGDTVLWRPDRTATILYLIVHGGLKHDWVCLKWIADIAGILERYTDLEWNRLFAEAHRLGLDRPLRRALHLARRLLLATLPEKVEADICRDQSLAAYSALVAGRLFHPRGGLPGFEEWARLMDRTSDPDTTGRKLPKRYTRSAQYLSLILSPSWSEQQSMPLPRPITFLHYCTRPFRLWRKHGWRIFGRLS